MMSTRDKGALETDQQGVCPICRSARFGAFNTPMGLSQCQCCGIVVSTHLWGVLDAIQIQRRWFSEPFNTRASRWTNVFERRNNYRTWSRIAPWAKVGSRLLEIGVGSGSFLELARERGLEVSGCDVSTPICADVQSRLGIRMFAGEVHQMPALELYDIVVANHVLEHTADPVGFLSAIRERMNRAGLLHAVVPNIDCWSARLPGWYSYLPYHLVYFSHLTLTRALRDSGFILINVATHETFSGYLLSAMRSVRRKVQQPEIVNTAPPTLPHPIKDTLWTLAVLLGALTLPARRLQGALGYGDELIALATTQGPR